MQRSMTLVNNLLSRPVSKITVGWEPSDDAAMRQTIAAMMRSGWTLYLEPQHRVTPT